MADASAIAEAHRTRAKNHAARAEVSKGAARKFAIGSRRAALSAGRASDTRPTIAFIKAERGPWGAAFRQREGTRYQFGYQFAKCFRRPSLASLGQPVISASSAYAVSTPLIGGGVAEW